MHISRNDMKLYNFRKKNAQLRATAESFKLHRSCICI